MSDLAEPREVAVWTAPDGWNDVGWDHRAFLWWAPESLAVIPVTVWNDWSGAVVLRVAGGTITEVGRVDHEIEGDRARPHRLPEASPIADLSVHRHGGLHYRARVHDLRRLRRGAGLRAR